MEWGPVNRRGKFCQSDSKSPESVHLRQKDGNRRWCLGKRVVQRVYVRAQSVAGHPAGLGLFSDPRWGLRHHLTFSTIAQYVLASGKIPI